eukprot:3760600-Alexandrium_andersonii.AAC.1
MEISQLVELGAAGGGEELEAAEFKTSQTAGREGAMARLRGEAESRRGGGPAARSRIVSSDPNLGRYTEKSQW